MANLNDFELELKKLKGKQGGYPRDINFSFVDHGKTLRAEMMSFHSTISEHQRTMVLL